MMFFRSIFFGAILLMPVAGAYADCCAYLQTGRGGTVLDCTKQLAKHQGYILCGGEKYNPIERAIMADNYAAVDALLNNSPELANTTTLDSSNGSKTVLEMAADWCCGNNSRDKIVQLLIDNGADTHISARLFSRVLGDKSTGTLVDLVNSHLKYDDSCKVGNSSCMNIKQKLSDYGVLASNDTSHKPETKTNANTDSDTDTNPSTDTNTSQPVNSMFDFGNFLTEKFVPLDINVLETTGQKYESCFAVSDIEYDMVSRGVDVPFSIQDLVSLCNSNINDSQNNDSCSIQCRGFVFEYMQNLMNSLNNIS